MDDFENYKVTKKAVKIFIGKPEGIEIQASEFEKTHKVINIIQKCSTMIFIFYLIDVGTGESIKQRPNIFEEVHLWKK